MVRGPKRTVVKRPSAIHRRTVEGSTFSSCAAPSIDSKEGIVSAASRLDSLNTLRMQARRLESVLQMSASETETPPPIYIAGEFPRLAYLEESVTVDDGVPYGLATVILTAAEVPLTKPALADLVVILIEVWPVKQNTREDTEQERRCSDAAAALVARNAPSITDAKRAVAAAWNIPTAAGAESKIRRGRRFLPEISWTEDGAHFDYGLPEIGVGCLRLSLPRGKVASDLPRPRKRLAERLGLAVEPVSPDVRERELERMTKAIYRLTP